MKVQLVVLMEVLVHKRKSLVLTLVKERVCIIMVKIIVIFLLMEKKSLSLKPIKEC